MSARRQGALGLVLAVVAALVADHGGHLGDAFARAALLGAALGGVLALVPARPVGKAIGFVLGALFALVGFALQAQLLPDVPMGHAVDAAAVVLLATAVAAASRGRLSLWAQLLGIAGMVGAYATTFALSPTTFLSDAPTAASAMLLASAVAFVVLSLLDASMESSADPSSATAPGEAPADDPGDAGLEVVGAADGRPEGAE